MFIFRTFHALKNGKYLFVELFTAFNSQGKPRKPL